METGISENKNRKKNKGGRPRKHIKMDKYIGVKCTLIEKTAIISNAKKLKLTASEFLRRLGLQRRIDIKIKRVPKEALSITALLNYLNANLNQVAKKKNKDEPFNAIERAEFLLLAKEIKAVVEQVKFFFK